MPKPREVTAVCAPEQTERRQEQMHVLANELHTMSQPMTALLCRLEIGSMTGTLDGYAEAVREGLAECDRLMRSMQRMRATVGEALKSP